MEIQLLLERFAQKDPKSLMEYVEKMASEEAPFFSTTLSLVYDKLVENSFPKRTFGSVSGKSAGHQSAFHRAPPPHVLTSTSSVAPPITSPAVPSSNLRSPTRGPDPPVTTDNSAQLKCVRCSGLARLRDLHQGLRCPRCPENSKGKRPFMKCPSCNAKRTTHRDDCCGKNCGRRFM